MDSWRDGAMLLPTPAAIAAMLTHILFAAATRWHAPLDITAASLPLHCRAVCRARTPYCRYAYERAALYGCRLRPQRCFYLPPMRRRRRDSAAPRYVRACHHPPDDAITCAPPRRR